MMRKISFLSFIVFGYFVNAQVGISKDMTFRPDTRTALHVKQDNEAVRLPRANNVAVLPASTTGTLNNGTQASIIYNKETGSIVQNDGTQWKISDNIVSLRKSGKTARFVRSGNAVLDFGTCGFFPVFSCTGNKVINAGNLFYSFSASGSGAYNDIPTDVSLVTATPNRIKFNTKGLYRITFKSGMANEEVPRVCVGITTNYYTRVDLQKSTDNGSSWIPIATNTSNKQVPGVLSVSDLVGMVTTLLNLNNTGMANAITYTGVFNANDVIRFTYHGNLNMGTAVCNPLITGDPTNMKLTFDGTGANATEIIIEKISL